MLSESALTTLYPQESKRSNLAWKLASEHKHSAPEAVLLLGLDG